MLYHLQYKVLKKDKQRAREYLQTQSSEPIYEIEDNNCYLIGGFFEKLPYPLPSFLSEPEKLPVDIDWNLQWQEFSPHIKDNRFELDLASYGLSKTLYLIPGPGFGDLSHPTTNLCLKHMASICKNQDVIDFGCGSGILSVAAYAFGASKVISLEIDPSSLKHAKENLILNGYPNEFVLSVMPNFKLTNPVCIINMTYGEQKIALKNLNIFPKCTRFLSSGILLEQKNAYVKWGLSQNLLFSVIEQEGNWIVLEGKFKD